MKDPWIVRREEGTEAGWEGWVLNHWSRALTAGWWYYLFGKLERGHYGGYEAPRWLNLNRIRDVRPRRWWPLFEETKLERLWCRYRGHPHGEVYYSSGDEPDHHCNDCGEEIG
jgi:hypothetical protein